LSNRNNKNGYKRKRHCNKNSRRKRSSYKILSFGYQTSKRLNRDKRDRRGKRDKKVRRYKRDRRDREYK
jgi:hypothetical protein